VCDIA